MVLSDQPNTLGTIALTQHYHGINTTHGGGGRDAPGQPGSPANLMAQLDTHFNNLESAATNSNSTLKQLATTTMYQYAEIKSSLDTLAANPRNPASTPGTRAKADALPLAKKRKLEKWIETPKAAIKNNWKWVASAPHMDTTLGRATTAKPVAPTGPVTSTVQLGPTLLDCGRTRTRGGMSDCLDASGGRHSKIN